VIHQLVSVVSQCSLNAWLSDWLAEINADLREAVAHYRRFVTMRYIQIHVLYFLYEESRVLSATAELYVTFHYPVATPVSIPCAAV